jgi:hypothetical protein
MLYREIIAVCSQIHTKHINTLCGQNVELLNVKLVVHIVTTVLYRRKRQRVMCILRPVFSSDKWKGNWNEGELAVFDNPQDTAAIDVMRRKTHTHPQVNNSEVQFQEI